MLSTYRGLQIVEAARKFRHEHKYEPSNAVKRIVKIAIVAIVALVYFAFGKFLGVRLPVGTVIKALR